MTSSRGAHLQIMKLDSPAVETDTDLALTGPSGKCMVPAEAVSSGSVLINYEWLSITRVNACIRSRNRTH